VPEDVLAWLRSQADGDPKPLTVTREAKQLVLSLQQRTTDDDWLVVMREVSDAAVVQALLQAFRLTMKEAEVLYWVAKGKTNRDIGDILGSSPATVKKHLEHVFEKLGVETRNAAASLAIGKVRLLA
jgi:DNA-binding CsgD family transcriptional regulator